MWFILEIVALSLWGIFLFGAALAIVVDAVVNWKHRPHRLMDLSASLIAFVLNLILRSWPMLLESVIVGAIVAVVGHVFGLPDLYAFILLMFLLFQSKRCLNFS